MGKPQVSLHTELPKHRLAVRGKLLGAVRGEGCRDPSPGAPRLSQQCPQSPSKTFP